MLALEKFVLLDGFGLKLFKTLQSVYCCLDSCKVSFAGGAARLWLSVRNLMISMHELHLCFKLLLTERSNLNRMNLGLDLPLLCLMLLLE